MDEYFVTYPRIIAPVISIIHTVKFDDNLIT